MYELRRAELGLYIPLPCTTHKRTPKSVMRFAPGTISRMNGVKHTCATVAKKREEPAQLSTSNGSVSLATAQCEHEVQHRPGGNGVVPGDFVVAHLPSSED